MSDLSEEEVRRMKRRAKGEAMAAVGVAAIGATGFTLEIELIINSNPRSRDCIEFLLVRKSS